MMAKKLIAYSCEFGCSRNVLTSKKRMEEHEDICFYNEKNRACATCRYLEREDRECIEGVNIENRLQSNCRSYKIRSE